MVSWMDDKEFILRFKHVFLCNVCPKSTVSWMIYVDKLDTETFTALTNPLWSAPHEKFSYKQVPSLHLYLLTPVNS